MLSFDFIPRTRVVFGTGSFERLGSLARELGFSRTLLVVDAGIVAAGHAARAVQYLESSGIHVHRFEDFDANPDSAMVERGRTFAAPLDIDSIVGLGGGSSLDCAKGINFLLTNGGTISDYRGYGKATRPLLPMIGVPTTAGTGSEAQSYAVISDSATHMKMACGDPSAALRIAILDPLLTLTAPRHVGAIAGYDAIAHAVETFVTRKRTPMSDLFSMQAWKLLTVSYERVLDRPDDVEARSRMQLGAFFAGMAIEQSMLGAAHACANPLTAGYDLAHGLALSMLLPHVVRWNGPIAGERYVMLVGGSSDDAAETLARMLERLATAGGLGGTLATAGVARTALPKLAAEAGQQWTGTFNPRPFDTDAALEIYRTAY